MQFAHNGYYKGSTPLGLKKEYKKFFNKFKGIWSSLVYVARFENEYFKKVVSSNLTMPYLNYKR